MFALLCSSLCSGVLYFWHKYTRCIYYTTLSNYIIDSYIFTKLALHFPQNQFSFTQLKDGKISIWVFSKAFETVMRLFKKNKGPNRNKVYTDGLHNAVKNWWLTIICILHPLVCNVTKARFEKTIFITTLSWTTFILTYILAKSPKSPG